MPHVIIKLWPGRTEQEKTKLSKIILNGIKEAVGCTADAVSIAIEEVPQDKWFDEVYYPDIEAKKETLYKKPGYGPKK
ncbi:MAG: tautomerase family protein [Actinomycetota bacterium]